MNRKISKNTKTTPDKTPKGAVGTTNLNFSTERAGLGTPVIRSASSFRKASYIPFSSWSERYNTDNIYPQQLGRFAKNSPTNSAAISRKVMMTNGEGIDLSKLNITLTNILNDINPNGETINDILYKISRDYIMFGGFSLKVTWANNGLIKYLKHVPFEQVRVGTPNNTGEELEINYYVISNN
jgi:hypothetical protein